MSKVKNNSVLSQLPLFDPITIPLTQGYSTVIDPVDSDLVNYKWCVQLGANNKAYAKRRVKNKVQFLHHVIFERTFNRLLSKGEEVDHIDGDSLNNQRTNLRPSTHQQNLINTKLRSDNKSGYKGVTACLKRWKANIRIGGKQVHLGVFATPEEAYAAYCIAAKQHFGEFARLK